MGRAVDVEIGAKMPSVTKKMTQDKINTFEACGITDRPNIHNDPEAAKAAGIGATPIASGRMTSAFIGEIMQKFFGDKWAHAGKTDLTFIRPVRDGDTVTVHAVVKEKAAEGSATRVTFEVWAENQNGDKTAVGTATGLL